MARLIAPATRILDLTPLAYEHPELRDDGYPARESDLNWVIVRIAVQSEVRSWTSEFPAFTTGDLRALVDWCRALAGGDAGIGRGFEAMEPNLQFEAFGEGKSPRLRALFQLEYRPPGLPFAVPKDSPAQADDEDVVVEFQPSPAGLEMFATELERELEAFPVRHAPVIAPDQPRQA